MTSAGSERVQLSRAIIERIAGLIGCIATNFGSELSAALLVVS